jgi:hypothetical protein
MITAPPNLRPPEVRRCRNQAQAQRVAQDDVITRELLRQYGIPMYRVDVRIRMNKQYMHYHMYEYEAIRGYPKNNTT